MIPARCDDGRRACAARPRRLCRGDARVAAALLALSSAGGAWRRVGLGARGDVLVSWRALGVWSTAAAPVAASPAPAACSGRCAARVVAVWS